MKNLINNIVLYYSLIFRRKKLEKRIKENINSAFGSQVVLEVSISNPIQEVKMNKKKYRLGNQDKEYQLLDSFIGFIPEGFPNWDEWNNILGKKKYPCNVTLVKGNEKTNVFFKQIIIKDAFPMSFFGEKRANDWRLFGICAYKEGEEEFIIPLYPYE
jgi:hypothetical protein